MAQKISKRLAEIIEALPIKNGMRVLEIGCGPGVAAREIAGRIGKGYILAIDRSEKAIRLAIEGSKHEIEAGSLTFRQVAIENFELLSHEKPFDIAFAVRVGALDGRHPEIETKALIKIARALTKKGKLFIDGGNPLKEISLEPYRKRASQGKD
jgi:ubiquinone/menaquinone biosynthesis C-methylase UbiE